MYDEKCKYIEELSDQIELKKRLKRLRKRAKFIN